MAKSDSRVAGQDGDTEITLGVLTAVEENSALTQRSVASELGIALGLANAYLKRCVKKGLVKVKQVPPNRYAYYLTPQGFAEKSRLTAEYLTVSFNFFRRARTQCAGILSDCAGRGWRRVALWGVGDLAEIATLCADEAGVEIVGTVDPAAGHERFAGLPVAPTLARLGPVDAVVVTHLGAPQEAFDAAAAAMAPHRVLAPALLRVSRQGSNGGAPK